MSKSWLLSGRLGRFKLIEEACATMCGLGMTDRGGKDVQDGTYSSIASGVPRREIMKLVVEAMLR